jgi:hypothetical protein
VENLQIAIDAEEFDRCVHGVPGGMPVLPEGKDVRILLKPNATEGGNAAAVITFTVQLPDKTLARCQAVVTARLLETAGLAVKGWRENGHI